jgi:hypothetical protein
VFFCIFKSGLIAALFFWITTSPAWAQADQHTAVDTLPTLTLQQSLARDPVWHALLHLQQGLPQIADTKFLLSWPKFSSEAELRATLELITATPQTAACRFPARTLWLQSRMELPDLDTSLCPEIQEFIQKAPFDRLELVFADESVTQPASVLGHSFLKISGPRNEQAIDHAVSFYTHAETFNLPKLLWDSLITGKAGLFSLTPYAQEENKYIEDEQRNIWRYEVRTTAFERALIRNHLFELKNSHLTYFFHRYNCATVLHNILALTGDLPIKSKWWITPKDVVKDLQAANRIANVNVSLADTWLIANLTAALPNMTRTRQQLIEGLTRQGGEVASGDQQQLEALHAYNRWLKRQGKISETIYRNNVDQLTNAAGTTDAPSLKVSETLDPRSTQGETHWRTSWLRSGGQNQLQLQWIPVSHTLMQSHSHTSAETEMVLLSPTISLLKNESLRMQEFQIFSMKSLIPWNSWLRRWSTQTLISYGSMTGHPLDPRSLHATLQLGATSRHGPLDLFAVAGPGLSTQTSGATNGVWRTDIGLLWRHEDLGKSRLTLTHWERGLHNAKKFEIEQSWFHKRDWLLSWKFSNVEQLASRHRGTGVSLMRTF